MNTTLRQYYPEVEKFRNLHKVFSVTNIRKKEIREALFTSRVLVRAWADSLPSATRLFQGRAFIQCVLERYWEINFAAELPFTKFDEPVNSLNRTMVSLANSIAQSSSCLSYVEASYHIGVLYTLILSNEERTKNGAFYTPPNIVERMLENLEAQNVNFRKSTVLDPACGSGIFLVAIADRIVRASKFSEAEETLAIIRNNLKGWEIDPFSAWMTEVFLQVTAKCLIIKLGTTIKGNVQVGNSLIIALSERNEFDVVIGNPPYGKTKLNEDLRTNYSRSLFGHANLYGLFMDVALSKTKSKGYIAFVTPTSFLSGEYFKKLRALYEENTTPLFFDFVSDRKGIFHDVLQETLLGIYHKVVLPVSGKFHVNEVISSLSNENEYKIEVKKIGAIRNNFRNGCAWLIPRSSAQNKLLKLVGSAKSTLSDLGYEINTGQLVWNRHKKQLRSIQDCKEVLPLIWAESISPAGKFVQSSAKRNHVPFINVTSNQKHLITDSPCILIQRTTSKEQSRRIIAAILPNNLAKNGVVIENHINIVKAVEPKVSLKLVHAILNSKLFDEVFRCLSGSVAVSAYELESVPFPSNSKLLRLEKILKKNISQEKFEIEFRKSFE